MQIVIELDDKFYKNILNNTYDYGDMNIIIQNGTPLPKNHGRLIDADALVDTLGASDRDIYCKAVIEEDAPTIIERSESE